MLRLPFLFIVTGLFCFGLFHLLMLFDAAKWMLGSPRISSGWFRVHLLVLGWGTMVAMGAVYQLISVVMQTPLYSRKLGYVHYVVFTAGAAGLLWGFQRMDVAVLAAAALLTLIGIALFVYNVMATLFRVKQWNVISLGVAAAVTYLSLTGLFGLLLGLNFALQLWPDMHERFLHTHIWLGAVGWFGTLIIGFSYKMLPMFYLAHNYPVRLQRWIMMLWNAGTIAGMIALLTAAHVIWTSLAILCVLLASLAYNRHISDIQKTRHKKQPGLGVLAAVYSARALSVVAALSLTGSLYYGDQIDEPLIVLVGWAYIWGWIAITILGYLSKIVPFLWWTHKYGSQMGKKKIPVMAHLIPDRAVGWGLSVIGAATVALIFGLWAEFSALIQTSGIALSVASLFYCGLVVRVFTK